MTVLGTIARLPKGKAEIWVICPDCNKERWAPYGKTTMWRVKRRCVPCNRQHTRKSFNLEQGRRP